MILDPSENMMPIITAENSETKKMLHSLVVHDSAISTVGKKEDISQEVIVLRYHIEG